MWSQPALLGTCRDGPEAGGEARFTGDGCTRMLLLVLPHTPQPSGSHLLALLPSIHTLCVLPVPVNLVHIFK